VPGAKKAKESTPPVPGFTRRVQRTGASSLSVTLPKSWTDSMNLKTGDVLRFRDLGEGRLEISPAGLEGPPERSQKLLKVDATDAPANLLARLLIGGYITGQDQILVTSRTPMAVEQRLEIRRTVAHVLGMSVVEEDANRIEIQNFVDPGRYPLQRLLNQVVRMLQAELASCRKALLDGDKEHLQQVAPMEDEVDRFYLLMVRQLLLSSDDFQVARDIGVESHHYQIGNRLIAKVLEVTGDLVSGVAQELAENLHGLHRLPKPALDDLVGLITRLEDALGQTMEAFTRLSVVAANRVLNEMERTADTDGALGESIAHRSDNRPVAISAQRIVSSLLMVREMMVVINEVTINRGVEPETVARSDRKVVLDAIGPETQPKGPRHLY
jgi:phosphate uptake regulator